MTTFKSVDPVKRGGIGPTAHIALYQGVTNVRIGNLIVRSKKPSPLFIMDSDKPATVVVDSHDIKTPRGTPMVGRSEEHTSELQSLMRISYAVFCLKKKHQKHQQHTHRNNTTITERHIQNKN